MYENVLPIFIASGEHCTLHVYNNSQEEGNLINCTKSMSIHITQIADHTNAR